MYAFSVDVPMPIESYAAVMNMVLNLDEVITKE